ncbi:NAD(P)-dependent oxidoreductase [Chthonobacter albigriseus]|uniref:NAD(P)-dependent oxidoreductase n=1 Tax=Chthonobacter albigriseus TaxID=1683161 RepID=UPI0015EF2A4A|nr:NAD(P)-dependent oxidoreductase [Chthonobacter albigriseus]
MKIAVIGASGRAGSEIALELARRGHAVTGIARNAGKVPAAAGITAVSADADDPDGLAAALKGHDAVVSAIMFHASDPLKLIAAVKASSVKRYLVVGGAGSLEVAPGVRLVDTPEFPAIYKGEALAGARFLDLLKADTDLDWSFLSPSALFDVGPHTGAFRLGTDQLLVSAEGKSFISFADYAIAMADEIEKPAHVRRRFTVGT